MNTPSIVIASSARTAVGSFNGAFANTPAHELGAAVIKGVLERAGVQASEVDEVILGQVLQAGEGPIPASRKALAKAGWAIGDVELVEANEAFAAQACAVNKDLGWNPDIVNVNGGAIAIGHSIGASGARVLNTLLFEMKRRSAKKGLATLCIGGGMGVAMCVEAFWARS
ncbi:hypothetical protein [Phyllobacterium zundukense]|uniref:Uncharacterized protein n=1 Tax=Phyllobacterium zundukense TaxID=1867719 RepID=A0ACD4CVF6_9HYPH|nr:hypothetical protein [Phyllobacterium zundukense]UXN57560.1 hypothetical protein N8E88_04340 [Phyllobacterium zundukense]